jgi:hypothetical protein
MNGVPPLAAAAGQWASIPMVAGTSCPNQGPVRTRLLLALVYKHPVAAALRRHDTEG